MDFNLSTDIKQSIPNAIVFNFEELKAELSEKIKPYEKIHQDLRLDSRWSHSERLCEPLAPMMGRFTYRRVLDNDK